MNSWKNIDMKTLLMVRNILVNRRNKASFLAALSLATLLSSGFARDDATPFLQKDDKLKMEYPEDNYLEMVYDQMEDFYNRPIEEQQEDFLAKYNVDYQELIKAVTSEVYGVDYSNSEKIKARIDFLDMKKDFEALTLKKVDYILKRYNITYDNFTLICKVVLRESGGYRYNESYHVVSTLINRTHDLAWVNAVSKDFGVDGGYNIYNQLTYRNHYACDNIPERFDNFTNWIGYYAVLDALVTEKVSHEYTEFASSSYEDGISRKQLESGGNKYCHKVKNWISNPTLSEVTYSSPRVGDIAASRIKSLEDIAGYIIK